jgi:hypothetical protein
MYTEYFKALKKHISRTQMLYIYGDSHGDFSFRNLQYPHRKRIMYSKTMHGVGTNHVLPMFETSDLSPESIFIFSHGEVDCRSHVKIQTEKGRDEDEVIEKLAINYIDFIATIIHTFKKIIILAIPPPVSVEDFPNKMIEVPINGSDGERVRFSLKLNNILERSCIAHNFIFFNPYEYYTRPNGTLKYEFSDKTLHIQDNSVILEKLALLLAIDGETESVILNSTEPSEFRSVVSASYPVYSQDIGPRLIITKKVVEDPIEEYYFFFSNPGADAFLHWVIEVFIFYPLFIQKLKVHPNTKILIPGNRKRYCSNFFAYLGISSPIVHEISTSKNIVFFPPVCSLNKYNMSVLDKYITNYMSDIVIDILPSVKLLYLPRNRKENFAVNDTPERSAEVESISDIVIRNNGIILDTYSINNIRLQFNLVASASIIVVHWGSSFYVNCLHVKNKIIILLNDSVGIYQINAYESMGYMFKQIEMNNKIISLASPYANTLERVLALL